MFGLSKKEKMQIRGYYCIIDWTDASKEWAVGGNENKRIFHFYDGYPAREPESYSEEKVRFLKKRGVPIYDKTRGYPYPKDSVEVPISQQALGIIELMRKVP